MTQLANISHYRIEMDLNADSLQLTTDVHLPL